MKYIQSRTCWLGNKEALWDDHFIFRVPGPVNHAFTTLHGEVDVSHHRHCWKSLDAGHCRIQTYQCKNTDDQYNVFWSIWELVECLIENQPSYIYHKVNEQYYVYYINMSIFMILGWFVSFFKCCCTSAQHVCSFQTLERTNNLYFNCYSWPGKGADNFGYTLNAQETRRNS